MNDTVELSTVGTADWMRATTDTVIRTYLPVELSSGWVFSLLPQNAPPMTEDLEDRLTLEGAAERYEGKDWRATFKPLG
jgi:hypothetical protein